MPGWCRPPSTLLQWRVDGNRTERRHGQLFLVQSVPRVVGSRWLTEEGEESRAERNEPVDESGWRKLELQDYQHRELPSTGTNCCGGRRKWLGWSPALRPEKTAECEVSRNVSCKLIVYTDTELQRDRVGDRDLEFLSRVNSSWCPTLNGRRNLPGRRRRRIS